MTRTTDDLNPTEPWRPLGERVKVVPPLPKDREVAPGVFKGTDGRLYTKLPLPEEKP
jgi:hypothetical protein